MTDTLLVSQKTSTSPAITKLATTAGPSNSSPPSSKLTNGNCSSASSSSANSSLCPSPPPPPDLPPTSEAEELRRENERLLAELANTQALLDLFEEYRNLLTEQMNMCICSGRDYHLERFRKCEAQYRSRLPIKRIIEHSQLLRATGAEQYSDDVVSLVDGGVLDFDALAESKNGDLLQRWNGAGKVGGLTSRTAPVSTGDVICSTVPTTAGKSKVRAFLDQLEQPLGPSPSTSSRSLLQPQLPQVQSIVAAVPLNGTSPPSGSGQHPPHQFLHSTPNYKAGQIIVRKRMAPPEMMTVGEDEDTSGSGSAPVTSQLPSGIVIKKAKLGSGTSSFVPGQKYTILTTNNKFSIAATTPTKMVHPVNGGGSGHSADHEEERLDQLNNALDQILMGRYDALNQLGQPNGRTMLRRSGGGLQVKNQPLEQTSEDEDDDGGQVVGGNDEDEDIIFLDEIKNAAAAANKQTATATAIAVPLKPKIVIASGNASSSTAPAAPSILGAALESGFKPYPTYGASKVNGSATSNGQPIMNHATIKLFQPTTSQTAIGTTTSTPITVAFQAGPAVGNQTTSGGNITVINNKSLWPNNAQKRPHLTNDERMDIISRLKKNESGARIARDYGITKQAVSAIKRRAQLMGDNFASVNTYIQAFSAGSGNGNANSTSAGTSHGATKGSTTSSSSITINLSSPSSGASGSSPTIVDNSLVSRQLKQQQKVANASVLRQSNLHLAAAMPRSTSNLCLPVNPVAILKSQMAKQGSVSSSGSGSRASTPTKMTPAAPAAANSPAAKLRINSKQLLLPRLLQGTETYQTYASTSKDPTELEEEEEEEEAVAGSPEIKEEDDEDDVEDQSGQQLQQQTRQHRTGKPYSFAMQQAMAQREAASDEESADEEEGPTYELVDPNDELQLEGEEENGGEQYEDDPGFDPTELMDFGGLQEGEVNEDDSNGDQGHQMVMFEGMDDPNSLDEPLFVHGGSGPEQDDEEEEEEEDGAMVNDFDQFNESLLMSD